MRAWLVGCISLACAATVLGAAPAGAVIATTESGSYVYVGNKWTAQSQTICGTDFSYVQRMTIDGVSMMVPTQYVYRPGRQALVLLETCDGVNIYGVGPSGG